MRPKYKIGQEVALIDEFSSNPGEKALKVTTVKGFKLIQDSIFKKDVEPHIVYYLDAHGTTVKEEDLIYFGDYEANLEYYYDLLKGGKEG